MKCRQNGMQRPKERLITKKTCSLGWWEVQKSAEKNCLFFGQVFMLQYINNGANFLNSSVVLFDNVTNRKNVTTTRKNTV